MRSIRRAVIQACDYLYGRNRTDALVEGWRHLREHPEVMRDLAILGHLNEPDINPETGELYPPNALIERAARRSLILGIFARAEVTEDELTLIRQGETNETEQSIDGEY